MAKTSETKSEAALRVARQAMDLAHQVTDVYAAACIAIREDDRLFDEAQAIIKRLVKSSGKKDPQAADWNKRVNGLAKKAKKNIQLAKKGKFKYTDKDLL